LKRFRKTAWSFQQTFLNPRKNLQPFVDLIISASESNGVKITIDQVIFDPTQLNALLASHSQTLSLTHDVTISAEGLAETTALLHAALSDAPDFICIPTPKPFVFYADHDEYITVFSHTKSNLNRIVLPLVQAGFKIVDYRRQL
jgi:hypothetical protein